MFRDSRFGARVSELACRGSRFGVRGLGFAFRGSRFGIRVSGFALRGSRFGVNVSGLALRGSRSGLAFRGSRFGALPPPSLRSRFGSQRLAIASASRRVGFVSASLRCRVGSLRLGIASASRRVRVALASLRFRFGSLRLGIASASRCVAVGSASRRSHFGSLPHRQRKPLCVADIVGNPSVTQCLYCPLSKITNAFSKFLSPPFIFKTSLVGVGWSGLDLTRVVDGRVPPLGAAKQVTCG